MTLPSPDHRHDHRSPDAPRGRLAAAATINTGFAVVQIIVGLMIGSVVVLADAAHQVVDAIGLLTALGAAVLAARPSTPEMSFGWGKTDALGAFVSSLLLLGSVTWIAYESISRLFDPVEVDAGGVVAIGLVAVAVNGGSLLLIGVGHANLSIRAARLHLLTDLAGSVIVVAAGLALAGTSWTWIDPAASLVLCAAVVRSTIGLLQGASHELLDRAPSNITPAQVTATLTAQPGIEDVHHVHVRPLGQQRTSVTAHVVVDGEQRLHDAQERIGQLTATLERELDVDHATLQLECHPCADDDC